MDLNSIMYKFHITKRNFLDFWALLKDTLTTSSIKKISIKVLKKKKKKKDILIQSECKHGMGFVIKFWWQGIPWEENLNKLQNCFHHILSWYGWIIRIHLSFSLLFPLYRSLLLFQIYIWKIMITSPFAYIKLAWSVEDYQPTNRWHKLRGIFDFEISNKWIHSAECESRWAPKN